MGSVDPELHMLPMWLGDEQRDSRMHHSEWFSVLQGALSTLF
jgi:hypothetical protein